MSMSSMPITLTGKAKGKTPEISLPRKQTEKIKASCVKIFMTVYLRKFI